MAGRQEYAQPPRSPPSVPVAVAVLIPIALAATLGWMAAAQDSMYRGAKQVLFPGLAGTTPHLLFDASVGLVLACVAMLLYRSAGSSLNRRILTDEAELSRLVQLVVADLHRQKGGAWAAPDY
jgi:hypothetical protein